MDPEQLWHQILGDVRDALTVSEYDNWFSPVGFVRQTEDALVLRVPDPLFSVRFIGNGSPVA